jgi:hypothetical protein
MVTETDMRAMVERWKRATRPLKAYEQEYGGQLVALLARNHGSELRIFDDPLEAATFIIFTGLLKDLDRDRSKD